MAADETPVNYPAVAWAWLTQRLAELDAGPDPSILGEWRALRQELDGTPTPGSSITDWPSDFWIAKTQGVTSGFFTPVWSIPERIDHWPALGLPAGSIDARWSGRSGAGLDELLAQATTEAPAAGDGARRFLDLNQATTAHGDQAMISADQIRAWVTTAFGDLLGGIAFTPTDDPEVFSAAVAAVRQRVALVDDLPYEQSRNSWMDFGCDALYNLEMTPEGVQPSGLGVPRQGQGTTWQQHWSWLSTAQEAHELEDSAQLAGQLMINEAMLSGLSQVVAGEDVSARRRAVCVVRRWLLTTKALAWVVEALRHPWTSVRPQDLATFAFGALSPAWPRRTAAVSHRSAEAKPVLTTLNMWNSPHIAVDATYVPAWETNTGMIWSLFAPVPIIARVVSPAYFESSWCRREHEMLQYLVDGADFLNGRTIIDVQVEELPELDRSLFTVTAEPVATARIASFPAAGGEFPPSALVLLADVAADLDVAVLRAASALRLICAHVGDPVLANQLVLHLVGGRDFDFEAPTNNPDGWAGYRKVFIDLGAAILRELDTGEASQPPPTPSTRLPLLLPETYSEEERWKDRRLAEQIPDLRSGKYDLADTLAALEWQRSVFEAFNEQGYGDKVATDVSRTNAEDWASDPRWSVARGMLALNNLASTWILQQAGQSAHTWSGFREQPVFTRHVEHQFSWLQRVWLHPTWLIYYLANSGLDIGPELESAMVTAVVRAAGPEAIVINREGDDVGLVVPEPGDFFLLAEDTFADVMKTLEAEA